MSISTLSLNSATLSSITKLKQKAADAMTESTTGRYVDVGLTLGRLTGTAVNYRVKETSIEAQLQTNKVTASRLKQSYDTMGAVNTTGQSIASSLLSAEKYTAYPELARSALQQMTGSMNQAIGNLYSFGGTNTDQAPMKDIDGGIAAAKQSFADFMTALGNASGTTVGAADVTTAQMEGFLSAKGYTVTVAGVSTAYSFMSGFNLSTDAGGVAVDDDTDWKANWSTASDDVTEAKISTSESVVTSVSANEKGFRKVTAAYAMLSAIGGEALSEDVKKSLTKAASTTLAAGMADVTSMQAIVGTRQKRVEAAGTALTSQMDIVAKAYSDLEGVDQVEANQRYLALETQLQTAYTISGRIQKLSILDYI